MCSVSNVESDVPDRSDSVTKKVVLRASRARVWRAISDSTEFGSWFGMRVEGPFVAGTSAKGIITPTTVDNDVAQLQRSFEGLVFELRIVGVEPERLLSFRWHPHAVDREVDYSHEGRPS